MPLDSRALQPYPPGYRKFSCEAMHAACATAERKKSTRIASILSGISMDTILAHMHLWGYKVAPLGNPVVVPNQRKAVRAALKHPERVSEIAMKFGINPKYLREVLGRRAERILTDEKYAA